MKGKIIAICTISILFVAFALAFPVFINNFSNVSEKTKPSKSLSDQILPDDAFPDDLLTAGNKSDEKSENKMYLVKEHNGFIGVFKVDHANFNLCYIKDVKISNLPKEDQDLLRKGIFVSSKSELNNLLEDYCS